VSKPIRKREQVVAILCTERFNPHILGELGPHLA